MRYLILLMVACLYLACSNEAHKKNELTGEKPIRGLGDQGPVILPVNGENNTNSVIITGMKFEPPTISITPGDTITWINKDIYAHDVTELKEQKWRSGKLEPGASWKMVVNKPSDYYCSLHVVMKGKIEIKNSDK